MAKCSPEGIIDFDNMKSLMRKNTKAVIVNHGSNVTGTIQPLQEVKKVIGDTILILDACQTIGAYPIDVERDRYRFAVFFMS